jgi:hypothetical protein
MSDVQYIINSYLNLEEYLILNHKNLYSHKIIKKIWPLPPIYTVCEDGDLYTLKYLHSLGHKIEYYHLLNAMKNGHLRIAKFIIDCDIYAPGGLCHYVTNMRNLLLIKYLVKKGYKPNNSTLIVATCYLPILRYFVKSGFILPKNILEFACRRGELPTIKFLIRRGYKPNVNHLQLAIHYGYLQITKYLINIGLEPNKDMITYSKYNGLLKISEYLEKYFQKKDITP